MRCPDDRDPGWGVTVNTEFLDNTTILSLPPPQNGENSIELPHLDEKYFSFLQLMVPTLGVTGRGPRSRTVWVSPLI